VALGLQVSIDDVADKIAGFGRCWCRRVHGTPFLACVGLVFYSNPSQGTCFGTFASYHPVTS